MATGRESNTAATPHHGAPETPTIGQWERAVRAAGRVSRGAVLGLVAHHEATPALWSLLREVAPGPDLLLTMALDPRARADAGTRTAIRAIAGPHRPAALACLVPVTPPEELRALWAACLACGVAFAAALAPAFTPVQRAQLTGADVTPLCAAPEAETRVHGIALLGQVRADLAA
jgi:hypothetical protein